MPSKTLKGIYFQIQINSVKKSKKQKGSTAEEATEVTSSATSESTTSGQTSPSTRTLTGSELSALIDKVLQKNFNDRFLGNGDYAFAGHGDRIASDMTSIPEDKDGYRYFLFTKKRSDAPTQTKVENDGTIKISPIQIDSSSFISETTLMILNTETGVILELMNKNAGSTGSLAYYLSLCDGKPIPDYYEVLPVLNIQKAMGRLGVMNALNKFEFSLSTALLPTQQNSSTLDSLFSEVGDVAKSPATRKVNIVLSANKGESLDKPGVVKIVKKLLNLQNDVPNGILRVSGLGPDSTIDVIDFINDDFLFLLKYKLETRYINTGVVFGLMTKDYKKRLPKIKQSIGMAPS